MNYFCRTGYVSIEDKDGKWRNYGGDDDSLDFKFSGEKFGSIYTWFDVSILGLSSDTINDLTVWNPGKSAERKRRIRVYAGYAEGSNKEPIYEGIIFEAMPTNPPEMWMNFKCLRIDFPNEKTDWYYPDMTLGSIASSLAGALKLDGMRWDSETVDENKKVRFHAGGSVSAAINRFAADFDVKTYEDNGILVVCDKRVWLNEPKAAEEISTETGMLALGNITLAGARIKRRLNDSVPLMGWIRLKSTIVPKANGLYCVIKKSHQGHFRGNEWFTELECIRQGADV